MNSLEDLNNRAGNDLQEFTDFRASNVVWDVKDYNTTFSVTQDENQFISIPFPLRILEIVNYQAANVRLEFDFSNTTGEIFFEKSWPSWASVTTAGRVVTVAGFQHNLHFNEIYNLGQRVRLTGYFGTSTVTVRIRYVRSGVEDSRPWTIALNIAQVLNLTSPAAEVYYGIQATTDPMINISNPTVVDPSGLGVDWRMTVYPTNAAGLHQISVPNTSGATVAIDSNTKTVVIEGTLAQVNTELAGLQVRFGTAEIDFDINFELEDIFDDSTAGLVTDLKVTRYKTATTGLEILRQWQYNDVSNESLEKPFRDGTFRLFAPEGVNVELTISVPNNAFRYYQDLNTLVYSLEQTTVTLTGYTIPQLQQIITGLWYKATQNYTGAIEWVFTIKHVANGVSRTVMDGYLYDMLGQYIVWSGLANINGGMTSPTLGGGPYYEGDVITSWTWNGDEILSISNPVDANIIMTFDLDYFNNDPNFGYPGTDLVLEWDNVPEGITINRTANNRYRITGIDEPSDFTALRIPTRIRTANDMDTNGAVIGIYCNITWTGGRQRNWTMGFRINGEREFDSSDWPLIQQDNLSDYYLYNPDQIAFPRGYTDGVLYGPQIMDEGTSNPIYTITVVPDKPNTVTEIRTTSGFSGFSFNPTSKIATATGSKTVVNDIMSKLRISFDRNYFEDQYVRFRLTNNTNDETDECGVWFEGYFDDPVFRWNASIQPGPATLKTDPVIFDENLLHSYTGSRKIDAYNDPLWNPGELTIGLYDSTYLSSVTIQNPLSVVEVPGVSNTSGYNYNITGDILVPKTLVAVYLDNFNSAFPVSGPLDLGSYDYISAGDNIYRAELASVRRGSRVFRPTYFGPSQYFNSQTGTIDGPSGFRNDPPVPGYTANGLEYYTFDRDDQGWIFRHEPLHYGNCISSNSTDTLIAISHAGEVYTDGIYFDEYYYGPEFSGVLGEAGTVFTGNFIGTEWGDYFYNTNDYTQTQNTYQGRHTGCVYIYNNQDTLHNGNNFLPLPIQKIYPPISDQPGDQIAPVGNHLLFGEYSNISPDGNRLVITCPGWQNGNVNGQSLKGVYTYTWNSVTEQFDFDAVTGNTALINPQWNRDGTRLVGEDRDDPTKLRIYGRNSNGSLSLNETLPLPSARPFRWDYSPITETIVVAQTDGTVDVYEINQSTGDYSKTQEFVKGAIQNNTEIQISHDGLVVLWKILGYSNSTDANNNFTGWGVAVFYRNNSLDQFTTSINQTENFVEQLNGTEYQLIDFGEQLPSYYRNETGSVFPLGNRLTITDRITIPGPASVDPVNKTATFTTGTNQTAKFVFNGNQPNIHTEFFVRYTPDDSTDFVQRNFSWWYWDATLEEILARPTRRRYDWQAVVGQPDQPYPLLNNITGGTPADL